VFTKKAGTSEPTEGALAVNLRAWVGIAVCVFAYPALLMTLDFVVSTFVTVFAMLLVLRFKTWPVCLVVSLFTAIACFVVFAILLGVALPSGFIEGYLYRLRG
jgi:hypothetical protein